MATDDDVIENVKQEVHSETIMQMVEGGGTLGRAWEWGSCEGPGAVLLAYDATQFGTIKLKGEATVSS